MSSEKVLVTQENKYFVKRFIEVCDTELPTEIANLLSISYQAAKNYLNGRYPDTKTLLTIANKTPYSVHWLITGEGEKFINQSDMGEDILLKDSLKSIVNSEFLEEFLVLLSRFKMKNKHTSSDSPKTVILTLDKIREQKVEDLDTADLTINPS